MKGKVKWFSDEKGYGFIVSKEREDIFCHYSQIVKEDYKTLKPNQVVEFKLIETEKGLQAIEIKEV